MLELLPPEKMKSEERKELAKLIGMILTDGGIDRKWRMHFTTTSPILEEEFRKFTKQILDRPAIKERCHDAVRLVTRVTKLKDYFEKLSPVWRHQACTSFPYARCIKDSSFHKFHILKEDKKFPLVVIPDFILEDKVCSAEFLKYAFTCDGTVTFAVAKSKYGFRLHRKVKIACEHPLLKQQYSEILKSFGIDSYIEKDGIGITGRERIELFFKQIGFVKGVVILGKKVWGGIEKYKLLQLCVKSYEMNEVFELTSKEEIIDYLKSQIPLLEQEAA